MAALTLYKDTYNGSTDMTGTQTTQTVTIDTLQSTSKAILLFSVKCATGNANDYDVLGRIISTTQIQFERMATPAADCTITYWVIEFASGINVQHLYISQTTATVNTTITAVTLSKAFPILSMAQTGGTFGANDIGTAEITTTTNLATYMGSVSTCPIAVQVVEIDDATVDKYTGSYGTTDVCDVTVTSMTENKTFWLFTLSATGSFAFTGVPYLYRYAATTLRFLRYGTSGAYDFGYVLYVVAMSQNITVQNVTATIASGASSTTPAITSVTTGNSALLDNSLHQRMSLSNTTDDNSANNHVTLSFVTSTSIGVSRSGTPAIAATTNVQVLEFVKATTGSWFLLANKNEMVGFQNINGMR